MRVAYIRALVARDRECLPAPGPVLPSRFDYGAPASKDPHDFGRGAPCGEIEWDYEAPIGPCGALSARLR